MTLFIIFALLLTSRLVCGVTVTETIVTKAGSSPDLSIDMDERKEVNCTLKTNRNEVLKYNPQAGTIREDIQTQYFRYGCSVQIRKVNSSHAGVWKITVHKMHKRSHMIQDEEKEFILYIQENVPMDTSVDHIEVYEGQYVNVRQLNHYETLKSCNLTGRKPINESLDLLVDKRDDLQIFGQCGVRMKANANFSGAWILNATTDEDFVWYISTFYVNVLKQSEKDPDSDEVLELRWIRGATEKINLSIWPKICQIIDPSGTIVATTYNECTYKVKVANVQHEGIWRVRYNLRGMLEPIEQQLRIKTEDSRNFSVSVNRTTDGTKLICRLDLKSADSLTLCSFVRPDNETFYLSPSIGNERYSAYISPGYDTYGNILECGLTIRELESIDYGTWRCNLKVSSNSELHGSVFHVDYPDSRENGNTDAKDGAVKVWTNDVHVKRSDPFTVKCATNSVLKYCWLRSPNGTDYSVKKDNDDIDNSPFVLPYVGLGLSYGECGAKISAAEDSDEGQWSCFMGVVESGKEEVTTVSVKVAETYLVAEQTEIAISSHYDPVLSCNILPRMLDRTVHYCRWIRPDGYGIYNDTNHRYTPGVSYSQCRLVILNFNSKEDEGRWMCVAGLAGKSGQLEEAWAYIDVNCNMNRTGLDYSAFIGIMCGSLLLFASAVFLAFVIVRKRRRTLPSGPPPYIPNYPLPTLDQSTVDTKDIPKYNYS